MMSTPRRSIVALALGIAMLVAHAADALAQQFPSRPMRIVVPYTAGGPVDQLARAMAERLGKSLGQPVVVENKPGGNTIVAATAVINAPADGYTLFMASSASLAVNPLVYPRLPYNPDRDFVPISMVGQAPLVLVVGASTPATNLKELIPYIRAQGGNFAYASNGAGNPLHLACALFGTTAGVEMVHVPYNGTAPAMASVLSGDTRMTCDIVLSSLPQIKAGTLRPIGIVGPRRVAVLPNVPTLAEQGLPELDASVWFALVARSGTPAAIVTRLNAEVQKAAEDPQLRERFRALAMEVAGSESQDVTALTQRERNKWAAVVRQHAISIE